MTVSMEHSFLSAFIVLLLVPKTFASLPVFVPLIRDVAPERRRRLVVREGLIAFTVLLLCERVRKLPGDSVVSALEKLMGLVLTAIAVEMILAGLKLYFASGG